MKDTKVCERCGKVFARPHRYSKREWRENRKYCSRECVHPKKIKKECLHCREEFSVSQSRKDTKYCSWECRVEGMKGRRLSPETEFKKGHNLRHRFKKGGTPWNKGQKMAEEAREKLSSSVTALWEDPEYREMMNAKRPVLYGEKSPNWQGGKVELTCEVCGESFKVNRYRAEDASYCSADCYHEAQHGMLSGEDHWNWKGGVTTKHQRIRNSKEYDEWRFAVYKRDNYRCQDCNKKCSSEEIAAHHIKPFAEYPGLRFEVDNGVTLCRSCHKKRHSDIGIETRFKIKKEVCIKG